jgi:hypothetical protein
LQPNLFSRKFKRQLLQVRIAPLTNPLECNAEVQSLSHWETYIDSSYPKRPPHCYEMALPSR